MPVMIFGGGGEKPLRMRLHVCCKQNGINNGMHVEQIIPDAQSHRLIKLQATKEVENIMHVKLASVPFRSGF